GGRVVGAGDRVRHPGRAPAARHGAGPGTGGVVAGALADDDGVGQAVEDVGGSDLAVPVKQADAGLAVGAGQAVVPRAGLGVPAGAVKALQPAVAADVVAVRQRDDGGGEGAVVDGEVHLERVRGALEDLQGLLGDRRVAPRPHRHVEIDPVVDVVLFHVGQQ